MLTLRGLFLLSLCVLPTQYSTCLLRDEPLKKSWPPNVPTKDADINKLCRSNILVFNATLSNVKETLSACGYEIEYAPFLKFLLWKVFDLPVGYSSQDVSDREDYYEIILQMRKRDLKEIFGFIVSPDVNNTKKVQELLFDAIKIPKSSDKTWIQMFCLNLHFYMSTIILALLFAVAVKIVRLIRIPYSLSLIPFIDIINYFVCLKLRLPFGPTVIEIASRIPLADIVVPRNNPGIDNVRGVQELPFNVNRPQMVQNDANPADQNQIVQAQRQLSEDQGQFGQPCETAQCSNAASVNLDPEIDDSDFVDRPEDPSPSQDVQDGSAGVEDVSTDQNSQDSNGWVMDDVHKCIWNLCWPNKTKLEAGRFISTGQM